MFLFSQIVMWCSEGEVAEVNGGYDEDVDGGVEALPPLEDHGGMEVESDEWVERHQVPNSLHSCNLWHSGKRSM